MVSTLLEILEVLKRYRPAEVEVVFQPFLRFWELKKRLLERLQYEDCFNPS